MRVPKRVEPCPLDAGVPRDSRKRMGDRVWRDWPPIGVAEHERVGRQRLPTHGRGSLNLLAVSPEQELIS